MPLLSSIALIVLSQNAWKPYTLGGFGFQLPSPPVDATEQGQTKGSRYWRSIHNGSNAIVVGISTIDDAQAIANPDLVLAASIEGTIHESHGSLVSQTDAMVGGWPAIDFLVKSDEGLFYNVRSIVIDKQMLQIIVAGPSQAGVKPPLTRAIAGFSLGTAAQGPLKAPGPIFKPQVLGASGAVIDLPREAKEEAMPVNDKPGALVVHRFASGYLNRNYLAAFADIPNPEAAKEGDLEKLEQFANDDLIRSLKATALPSTDILLDGANGIRTIAKIGDKGVLRVESTVYKDRLYTIVAVVPTNWKDNKEVNAFFASFHFAAPKN